MDRMTNVDRSAPEGNGDGSKGGEDKAPYRLQTGSICWNGTPFRSHS